MSAHEKVWMINRETGRKILLYTMTMSKAQIKEANNQEGKCWKLVTDTEMTKKWVQLKLIE